MLWSKYKPGHSSHYPRPSPVQLTVPGDPKDAGRALEHQGHVKREYLLPYNHPKRSS